MEANRITVLAALISPREAWAIHRVLCNQPVNGETGTWDKSPEMLFTYLASLPPEQRQAAWNTIVATRSDGAELAAAVLATDANEPCPEDKAGAGPRPGSVVMRCAADIEPRPVEWLWDPRLPLGMISLFAGDPKLGKSFVAIAVTASISRGAPLPFDQPAPPGSVVLLSAEDDSARTIIPRLKASGANLEKIHLLDSVILVDGNEALPSLRTDTEKIGNAVAALKDCRLIIIDPVSAYLGGADDYKNAELRGLLSPLKKMAERLDAAVVLITHLNKGASTNGKHRVTGSIAYVGASRANFLFVRDREDPIGRRVFMLDNGCNLVESVPTLAYRIEDRGDGPAVEWETESVDITVEDALAAEAENRTGKSDASERKDAALWLKEVLANGRIPAKEIEALLRNAGFSLRTLKRAKEDIGVQSIREGFGKDATWFWEAPDACKDEGKSP